MSTTYTVPPWLKEPSSPEVPYSAKKALGDLNGIAYALHLFLASHMFESEEYCNKSDPKKERLYFATGFGLIQCVKGLMSFEDVDLLAAIGHVKHGNAIAQQHRKRSAALATRIAGLVLSSLNTSGVNFIKSMTDIERHAELVYAETLFEKALVGIAYSGDWFAFIKEALNMRTAFNTYRQLGRYLEEMDAAAQAVGKKEDTSIDAHFRSGVYLGVGMSNLILSIMPSRLLALIELFGYKGDRHIGLQMLYKAGGWTKEADEPAVGSAQEGVRRTICDMALIIFHLVFSAFTFEGIDMSMAEKILNYNIKRYPNGVFFLFGQGRLKLCRSQPAEALAYYQRAMEVQNQYRNLHHISFWEMSVANLALWDISASLECWRKLHAEATWSKATYAYGTAVCLLELGTAEGREEATRLMHEVPELRQRIAGKSIPLEKFIARKARKFTEQGGRLALAGLEFAYVFLGIAHAPHAVVQARMLPQVDALLARLDACKGRPGEYEGGHGYWDDLCLARFLQGICLRYIAYPDPDAVVDGSDEPESGKTDAQGRAAAAFEANLRDAANIQYDHYLLYYTHYEYGRLLACQGDKEGARRHLDLVMSGKALEMPPASRKGKYSMESALHIRTHAALEALELNRRL
ncbi:hypothetical protein PHLGIDRAFT_130658 [Phlebiopsis gigantea 11061_1 CR5-6]|uniref:Tetratricopeptide repeat protein 39B n=1 Tax=Phlebiopsis gigantea (strain 11061_1 CR5-6) TaxID=745531 RepID=A0A0C3RRC1_PHLG1|nr:hypothetical protein PHLGIDRAFT_130658 [Phlebiopsis gigantea 11061_1 CR5-6]